MLNHTPFIHFISRVFISLILFSLCLQRVDIQEVGLRLSRLHVGWFALALITYLTYQLLQAEFLQNSLQRFRLNRPFRYFLRLHYTENFYRLLVPGYQGHEACTLYLLYQEQGNKKWKLYRHLMGRRRVRLILQLMLLSLLLTEISRCYWLNDLPASYSYIFLLPLGLLFLKGLGQLPFKKRQFLHMLKTGGALLGLKLLAACFLLLALEIHHQQIVYLALFMLASLLAQSRMSFGGIGVRELLFVLAAQLMPIKAELGVSFALLLSLQQLVHAAPVLFMHFKPYQLPDASRLHPLLARELRH